MKKAGGAVRMRSAAQWNIDQALQENVNPAR